MALTQAERQKRYREKLKQQGRVLWHLWVDTELNKSIEKLLVTKENISKEKALQSFLHKAVVCVTSNATSHNQSVTSNVTSNDNILKENKQLKAKNAELQTRLNELEKVVTSNVTNNETSVTNNVISNETNVTSNLIFDLEKAKAIGTELKAQGMTANQISSELARQGYGNKRGKPFSKSSINKWFQTKS